MIAMTSLDNLYHAKQAAEQLKTQYPDKYQELFHLVSLTRQLQFRYQYLGSLLTDEAPGKSAPVHAWESVTDLYLHEVNKTKNSGNPNVLKSLFLKYKDCGYDNICLLMLGNSPEYLKGIQA
jgi:hypothetical protein